MPRCRRRANKTVKMRARALLSAKRSPARNWLAAVGFCTWRWKHKICLQFEWLKIEVQKSLKNIKCVLGQNWLTFVLSRKWWFERCISFSTRVSQTYNCKYCRNSQLWHCTWVKTIIVQVENTLFKQTSLQFFQQMYVKKCPSSIWYRDSNPQPLERDSLPITTRPVLPLVNQPKIWYAECR